MPRPHSGFGAYDLLRLYDGLSMAGSKETPLMKQWSEVKARMPGTIVLTRIGDFYELMNEDAEIGSRVLDITLTQRNNGGAKSTPLAGFPIKAASEYVPRLVKAGHRVAILEQVEDPALAKGLVRREVVETLTPGAVFADSVLSSNRNNFLLCAAEAGGVVALAAADITTGEVLISSCTREGLSGEIARYEPSEILLADTWSDGPLPGAEGVLHTYRPAWRFDVDLAMQEIRQRYRVRSPDAFGFQTQDTAHLIALGELLAYLSEIQPVALENLRPPRIERDGEVMLLDEMTRRNLELIDSLRPDLSTRAGALPSTVIDVVDQTQTAMGARLLRRWLLRPLLHRSHIEARHRAIEDLVENTGLRRSLRTELRLIRDLERLSSRVVANRATPRDMGSLGVSLEKLSILRDLLGEARSDLLHDIAENIDPLVDVVALIRSAIADDAPASVAEGSVIRTGYNAELDDLRSTREGAQNFLAHLQARERERTGFPGLKVGYNKVFGYYIEITRSGLDRVPEDYERKQTLANAERFITPELKEWEAKVLGAEERILELETRLFSEVRSTVAAQASRIHATAEQVAVLDVLACLAQVAEDRAYVRPEMHDGYDLEILGGRHPVVEAIMPREQFIANDVSLVKDARFWLLTGPNMAGKSTLLRMVGLVQLLAQIGSFVPARSARLPVVDRIFTRVGASDNLVRGQSTYLVEMSEAAAILHSATPRSLVLLDEIGRGTSTHDGMACASAITFYLHDSIGAKAIFATHYHELTQLEQVLPALANYSVLVREVGDEIVFLKQVQKGPADRSYGVEVARIAGLPQPVVSLAREILHRLESGQGIVQSPAPLDLDSLPLFQITRDPEPHPVLLEIRDADLESMTPLSALSYLAEIRERLRREAA